MAGDLTSNITPITRRLLHEEILAQLLSLLESGAIQPGERLPSERELAERFSVNRASVRQALSALSLLRLVEIKPGGGCYAGKRSEQGIDTLTTKSLISPEVVLDYIPDLMEARELIEIPLASKAAQRAEANAVAQLERTTDEMEKGRDDQSKFIELDKEFHFRIAEMAGNRVLTQLAGSISTILKAISNWITLTPERMDRTISQHRKILEAVRAGEPNQAAQAMSDHIRDVWETSADFIKT